MASLTHLDLDLLFMQSGGGYRVQVLRSPAGDGQSAMFALPFTALELENFVLKVGRFRARTRRVDSPPIAAAKHMGERLFDAVFTGAVAECLHRSVAHAVENNMLLRIRLRLSDCPDLANLPWELLYDSSDDWFLALSDRTPVVRYLQLPDPPRPLHVTLPLRVLVIKSEPVDYGHLDLDAEWAQVASALGELTGEGSIVLTELAAPTLSELRRALLRDTFHVVHYMGHGGFDQQHGGILLFTDGAGHSRPATGTDLGVMLRGHTSLRLAVLNSCEGARTDPTDPFAGVAETLVRRGIPAVVAMQFEVSDDAAIEFAPALYGALAAGLPIDAAVAEARKAVYTVSQLEWATPVLYLRADDAQLFTITQLSAAPSPSWLGEAAAITTASQQDKIARDTGTPLHTSERIARGISGVTELISQTLGPMGRTCVVRDQSGGEIEAPDARTIVEHIVPEDPGEVLGANYVRAMVGEQHHAAHDGAATAAVLAHAMVARTMDALHAGAHPTPLKRGITIAVEQVSQALSQVASDVEFKEQIASAATTSAGDPAIGEIIAEAMNYVGKEGVITVKRGSTFGLQLELTDGMRFEPGYISPHFVTDPERMEAVLEDPYILVTNAAISAIKDLQPLLDKVVQSDHPLVIIAADVEGEALAALVGNKLRGLFKSVAVKAPGAGEHRKAMVSDIAILTGGAVIGEEVGIKLEGADLHLLGRARKVVVTEDETAIVDGAGDADQIAARVNHIRAKLKEIPNTGSDDEREWLRERLARLAGGIAVIKVGAATEAELIQRKRRTESAVLIAHEAIETGLLPGGGAALVDVQRRLPRYDRPTSGHTPPTADEATGSAIVVDSLAEPLKQIVANAGHDPAALAGSIASWAPGTGFDVVTGTPRDMLKAGITDTVSVVSQALTNAANLAQRLLLLG